jgi:DNA invertase Pin-like site-specific DNA recombinase
MQKTADFRMPQCNPAHRSGSRVNTMLRTKRAAIYGRVSTDWQTTDNQIITLREVAARRGWDVVEVYVDHAISGTKKRDKRPAFDQMLKDASRRKFDIVMAWAIDRMGRSLRDLLQTIEHLEATGVDLYLDQQNIDSTTPAGKLLFQITGAFAEFERTMIQQRVNAGLARARAQGKRLGRPRIDPNDRHRVGWCGNVHLQSVHRLLGKPVDLLHDDQLALGQPRRLDLGLGGGAGVVWAQDLNDRFDH